LGSHQKIRLTPLERFQNGVGTMFPPAASASRRRTLTPGSKLLTFLGSLRARAEIFYVFAVAFGQLCTFVVSKPQ
jgi:hypothetical protein